MHLQDLVVRKLPEGLQAPEVPPHLLRPERQRRPADPAALLHHHFRQDLADRQDLEYLGVPVHLQAPADRQDLVHRQHRQGLVHHQHRQGLVHQQHQQGLGHHQRRQGPVHLELPEDLEYFRHPTN